MILNWANGEFTDQEKIIGAIYDAGCIRRSSLLEILLWKRSKLDAHLLRLRRQEMLITARDHHKETVYMLSEDGVRFAHKVIGIEGKAVTMEAQISHQLGVNDILLRLIKAHGREGVRWYGTREASDELFNFRKIAGNTDAEIRSSYIRPDALLRTTNGIFWIEFDNGTESGRQLRKKNLQFISNLSIIDEYTEGLMRRVVWVTPTAERAEWLETRWKEVKEKRKTNVEMLFYVAGEETSYLASGQDSANSKTTKTHYLIQEPS
jgi:hypothetical protein